MNEVMIPPLLQPKYSVVIEAHKDYVTIRVHQYGDDALETNGKAKEGFDDMRRLLEADGFRVAPLNKDKDEEK